MLTFFFYFSTAFSSLTISSASIKTQWNQSSSVLQAQELCTRLTFFTASHPLNSSEEQTLLYFAFLNTILVSTLASPDNKTTHLSTGNVTY